MPHPSERVAHDEDHPFHQIDIEISHLDHIVRNLIDDILSRGRNFSTNDIDALEKKYNEIMVKTESLSGMEFYREFRNYIERTIELIRSARNQLLQ